MNLKLRRCLHGIYDEFKPSIFSRYGRCLFQSSELSLVACSFGGCASPFGSQPTEFIFPVNIGSAFVAGINNLKPTRVRFENIAFSGAVSRGSFSDARHYSEKCTFNSTSALTFNQAVNTNILQFIDCEFSIPITFTTLMPITCLTRCKFNNALTFNNDVAGQILFTDCSFLSLTGLPIATKCYTISRYADLTTGIIRTDSSQYYQND